MASITKKQVLLTGGLGYIGSHTAVELMSAGYDCVIFDNLSNSSEVVLDRIEAILGPGMRPHFVRGDVRDREALAALFAAYPEVCAVLHFAGLKAVGESVAKPLEYYENNVDGLLAVLRAVRQAPRARAVLFSSSATVYGAGPCPLTEACPPGELTNPYGRTKLMCEQVLRDVAAAEPLLRVGVLRYFNPIGAHPSGLIGEDPCGVPNNLVPYASQVAVGRLPLLTVFGRDWDTPDGTALRDYIHVCDLARAHVAFLRHRLDGGGEGFALLNFGTGVPVSVQQVIDAFNRLLDAPLPVRDGPRREGDVGASYADPSRAEQLLGWRAKHGLDEMVRDALHWQRNNPQGYRSHEGARI